MPTYHNFLVEENEAEYEEYHEFPTEAVSEVGMFGWSLAEYKSKQTPLRL